jgi:hypothetical protein
MLLTVLLVVVVMLGISSCKQRAAQALHHRWCCS